MLHLLLVLLLVLGARRLWSPLRTSADIPLDSDTGGGGGGGQGNRVGYILLPPLTAPAPRAPHVSKPRTAPPPPIRRPAPAPVVPPISEAPPAAEPVPDAAPTDTAPRVAGTDGRESGVGAGRGGGEGSGVGTGTGPGAGQGTGDKAGAGSNGRGDSIRHPEPRQLVLPPSDYPKQLRGRAIEVTFWVDARGVVERVGVVPAIENRGFARKFEATMRQYRFRPARTSAGQPVSGSLTVKVAFF